MKADTHFVVSWSHTYMGHIYVKGKGKVDHAPPGRRWGAHLPLIAFEPVGG